MRVSQPLRVSKAAHSDCVGQLPSWFRNRCDSCEGNRNSKIAVHDRDNNPFLGEFCYNSEHLHEQTEAAVGVVVEVQHEIESHPLPQVPRLGQSATLSRLPEMQRKGSHNCALSGKTRRHSKSRRMI